MVCERTRIMKWLLSRVRQREVDSVKHYASEVLAILVQNSTANRKRLVDGNGIDTLLQVRSATARPCNVPCLPAFGVHVMQPAKQKCAYVDLVLAAQHTAQPSALRSRAQQQSSTSTHSRQLRSASSRSD